MWVRYDNWYTSDTCRINDNLERILRNSVIILLVVTECEPITKWLYVVHLFVHKCFHENEGHEVSVSYAGELLQACRKVATFAWRTHLDQRIGMATDCSFPRAFPLDHTICSTVSHNCATKMYMPVSNNAAASKVEYASLLKSKTFNLARFTTYDLKLKCVH